MMKSRCHERPDISARVRVSGMLELTSPAHIGGGDDDSTTDQPLLRDAAGAPYVPGTTLTGLLRSALEEEIGEQAASLIFGGPCGDDDGRPARLRIADARVIGAALTEIRDGVAIAPKRGVAEENKKFDVELLASGTRFALRLELDLPQDQPQSARLKGNLVALLALLERGRVCVGARTTRGFGALDVVEREGIRWTSASANLEAPGELLAWIGEDVAGLPADWPKLTSTEHASAAALAAHWLVGPPKIAKVPAGMSVGLTLTVAGSILIRSGGHEPTQPDAVHLTRQQVNGNTFGHAPIISGTSVAGALRQRCLRIANTMKPERGEALVAAMFGPRDLRRSTPHASRVEVAEARLDGGTTQRHTRVRIDPWLGGACEGLLFTTDPRFRDRVEGLRIHLRPLLQVPDEALDARELRNGVARALLLLAIRDLATGDLPIGGETGGGRGRLNGCGEFANITGERTASISLVDGEIRIQPAEAFDADFAALARWRNA